MTRSICLLLLWLVVAGIGGPALAQNVGTRVILTFDAESDEDAVAIRRLDLQEPATYFFTGVFVENHPELVNRLARGNNTIGSHSYSHPDLSLLNDVELRKELLLPKLLIEQTTGITPVWFRAPYLSYDDRTMSLLNELGFRFDSSDQERWTRAHALVELPISVDAEGGTLASDYELFDRNRLTDEQALEWLRRQYNDRAVTGRPFVFLMHPRIIAQHPRTLFGFIDHVRTQGGTFLTADEWRRTALDRSPVRWGTWVDFSLGEHDPKTIVSDVVEAGLTDVFVMARDPAGNDYYSGAAASPSTAPNHDLFGQTVALLRANGIRTHAWLPVFHNSYLAQMRPDLAMVAGDGTRSLDWLAPDRSEVRSGILDTILDLLRRYEIDGIHLDYLRYPSLEYDAGSAALAAFQKDLDLDGVTADLALSEHYNLWTDWRMRQLTEFAGEIREAIGTASDRPLILSAALIADAALSYRSMEEYGQNYAGLAQYLDIVIPMAYFKEDRRPLDWIEDVLWATRFHVGAKPVFVGLEGYQKPGRWTHDPVQFATALKMAARGSDGVVIYPYLYMFGRGDDEWNMPPSSFPALSRAVARARAEPADTEPVEATGRTADAAGPRVPAAEQRPPWGGWGVGLLMLAGAIGLGVAATAARRKVGPVETAPKLPAITTSDKDVLVRIDWTGLERESGGALFATLLRQLGPIGIERCRVIFLLDLLERSEGDVGSLLEELSGVEGWNRLALRYLEEMNLLGYLSLDGKRASLTSVGAQHLQRALEQGFHSSIWKVLEARLHESVDLTCGRCGSPNQGHWFWQEVECVRCRHPVAVQRVVDACAPADPG